jgi:hypothetical protein
MKKNYIKPSVGIVLLKSDLMVLENSGVAYDPMAKQQEVEVEEEEKVETGIPTSFTSLWGDEEEKED